MVPSAIARSTFGRILKTLRAVRRAPCIIPYAVQFILSLARSPLDVATSQASSHTPYNLYFRWRGALWMWQRPRGKRPPFFLYGDRSKFLRLGLCKVIPHGVTMAPKNMRISCDFGVILMSFWLPWGSWNVRRTRVDPKGAKVRKSDLQMSPFGCPFGVILEHFSVNYAKIRPKKPSRKKHHKKRRKR